MILQELFENRLSDIHAAYQEYLRIGKSEKRKEEFTSAHGMSPDAWVRRNQDNINKLTAHQRPQPVGDEHLVRGSAVPPVAEESQDDRNARIIAGEIEDAMSQGNEQLAKQKIKQLIQVGYTLNKDGKLQRMGMYEEFELQEKQDACYRKVKSRYKVWPSAYASGALVQCRKKGAANWGNKTKK